MRQRRNCCEVIIAVAKRLYKLNESLIFARESGTPKRCTSVIPVAVAGTHCHHGCRSPTPMSQLSRDRDGCAIGPIAAFAELFCGTFMPIQRSAVREVAPGDGE